MAFVVSRWNRGVLPVAAGLAVLFSVIAAVAGPAWFDRDKAGFGEPTLDPSILGLLTLILVPVQLLLVAFAMRGFQQQWNVEVEVPREDADGYGGSGQIQPAQPVLRRRCARAYHLPRHARVAELAYAMASKAIVPSRTCGFESHPGYCCATTLRACLPG